MDHIVVGLDGSAAAEAALSWATELAAALETAGSSAPRLSAVTVIRPPRAGALGLPPGVPEDVHRQRREEHLVRLRDTVDHHSEQAGIPINLEVTDGDPADELLRHADGADLLVVGQTELGRVTGLILGSTAQRCAERASCPVVIIPPPEETQP